jgi:rhomboid-related protein 1/2/3
MIKENQCEDFPKGLATAILKNSDTNNDGRLDFEEFYKMSQYHTWLFKDLCVKYCRYVVPLRSGAIGDETGELNDSRVAFS